MYVFYKRKESLSKILLINNSSSETSGHTDLLTCLFNLGIDSEQLVILEGNDPALAKIVENDFSSIILSGGRRWLKYDEVVVQQDLIKKTKLPILGICYGFQLINYCFGAAKLMNVLPNMRWGFQQIHLLVNDPLTVNLPEKFWAFEFHKFIVGELGDQLELIARSVDGPEIIKVKNKNIYGLQFHPELTDAKVDPYPQIIIKNFLNLFN